MDLVMVKTVIMSYFVPKSVPDFFFKCVYIISHMLQRPLKEGDFVG